MSEKEYQIVKNLGNAIERMTDEEQDKLLAFAQGVAFAKQEQNRKEREDGREVTDR